MPHVISDSQHTMQSPIRFVMQHIPNALVQIAPERQKQFEEELVDFSLEYVDSGDFTCAVDVEKKYICLSRQVVELMWAISFGYITFYTKVIQVNKPRTKQFIDLTQNPDVAKAMQLLKWAYENCIHPKNQTVWPDDLPQPVVAPLQGSMENVADELSLCAIAVYLHHELAHIRLNHTERSIENERDADYAMADWILDHSLTLADPRFIKRSLGIAIAMEALTAYGIYTGNFGGRVHPNSYDRLVNTLSRHVTDPNHITWAVLVFTLKLHLDNRHIPTPDIVYASFKECVNAYADILSKP